MVLPSDPPDIDREYGGGGMTEKGKKRNIRYRTSLTCFHCNMYHFFSLGIGILKILSDTIQY